MRTLLTGVGLAVAASVIGGPLQAQGTFGATQAPRDEYEAPWKGALKSALKSALKITRTTSDRRRVEEAGTIMVVQHEGITTCPGKGALYLTNRSRNGNVKAPGSQLIKPCDPKTERPYTVGERVYVTDLQVQDDAVVFLLLSTEMATITEKGNTQQTRYRAAIAFEFPRESLPTATADSVIAGISRVLTVERTAPGGPKTVALGQTTAELESVLGKPEKIIDLGTKTIYVYKDIKVTLVDGKVADVQ
jgi:hypothetical protein